MPGLRRENRFSSSHFEQAVPMPLLRSPAHSSGALCDSAPAFLQYRSAYCNALNCVQVLDERTDNSWSIVAGLVSRNFDGMRCGGRRRHVRWDLPQTNFCSTARRLRGK